MCPINRDGVEGAAKPVRKQDVKMNIDFLGNNRDYAVLPFIVAAILAALWRVRDSVSCRARSPCTP